MADGGYQIIGWWMPVFLSIQRVCLEMLDSNSDSRCRLADAGFRIDGWRLNTGYWIFRVVENKVILQIEDDISKHTSTP